MISTPEDFDALKDAAGRHAKGEATKADVDLLNSVSLESWRLALVSVKKGIEVQFLAYEARRNKFEIEHTNDADMESKRDKFAADEIEWRSKALRFLTSIEQGIVYVNCIMKELIKQEVEDKVKEYESLGVFGA